MNWFIEELNKKNLEIEKKIGEMIETCEECMKYLDKKDQEFIEKSKEICAEVKGNLACVVQNELRGKGDVEKYLERINQDMRNMEAVCVRGK